MTPSRVYGADVQYIMFRLCHLLNSSHCEFSQASHPLGVCHAQYKTTAFYLFLYFSEGLVYKLQVPLSVHSCKVVEEGEENVKYLGKQYLIAGIQTGVSAFHTPTPAEERRL